mmetsp:Transcript_5226/g.12589  ORF Transcript_5226/g.12589 Transcript_5226/m.12589 type:complete len:205 (-) Transcript_5226:16-630(-)
MATAGQLQMFNKFAPDEMFGLDERAYDPIKGKIHRIHYIEDDKVSDAAMFKIWLEDHTLGHILRMELLRDENVLFAGYKVPHPLDHMIELRVQTLPKSSPQQALTRAVRNLRSECKSMLEQFDQGVRQLQTKGQVKDDDFARQLRQDPPGVSTVGETDATFSAAEGDMDIDLGFEETLAQLDGLEGMRASSPQSPDIGGSEFGP